MENSFPQDRSIITPTRLISLASRLMGRATGISRNRTITVVFRYDDFSDLSPIKIEQDLVNAFTQHSMPCTFGVIPFNAEPRAPDPSLVSTLRLSPRKIELLKSALGSDLINVALHGYSHENIRLAGEAAATEFQGLNYLAQLGKISQGKIFLEEILGTKVDTFIPPWNTYDHQTIAALQELGFSCLSADMHGEVSASDRIKLLPATVEPYELKLAIEKARLVPDASPLIVALIHPYDFGESGDFDVAAFVRLLEWIKGQKDIRVQSLDQVLQQDNNLSPERFSAYKASLARPRVTPAFLYLPLNGVYPSIPAIQRMSRLSQALTSLFFLVVLVVSMLAATLLEEAIFMVLPHYVDIYQIGLTAILVTLSLYALRDLALGFRGAVIVSATLGAILGIWITNL